MAYFTGICQVCFYKKDVQYLIDNVLSGFIRCCSCGGGVYFLREVLLIQPPPIILSSI